MPKITLTTAQINRLLKVPDLPQSITDELELALAKVDFAKASKVTRPESVKQFTLQAFQDLANEVGLRLLYSQDPVVRSRLAAGLRALSMDADAMRSVFTKLKEKHGDAQFTAHSIISYLDAATPTNSGTIAPNVKRRRTREDV